MLLGGNHELWCLWSPSQAAYETYAEADKQRWNWLLTSQPFWRPIGDKLGMNSYIASEEMREASPLKGTSSIKSAMSPRCHRQAYGTTVTPGNCTDKWPTGFTYKARYCSRETGWKPVHVRLWPPTTRESLQDDDNCETVNGTAHCWKCLWHAVHHSVFLQKDIYKFMYYMHYIYILYIYIPVVPGQAGGGSFHPIKRT